MFAVISHDRFTLFLKLQPSSPSFFSPSSSCSQHCWHQLALLRPSEDSRVNNWPDLTTLDPHFPKFTTRLARDRPDTSSASSCFNQVAPAFFSPVLLRQPTPPYRVHSVSVSLAFWIPAAAHTVVQTLTHLTCSTSRQCRLCRHVTSPRCQVPTSRRTPAFKHQHSGLAQRLDTSRHLIAKSPRHVLRMRSFSPSSVYA